MADSERLQAFARYVKDFQRAPAPDDEHPRIVLRLVDDGKPLERVLLAYDELGILVKNTGANPATSFYFWHRVASITPF